MAQHTAIVLPAKGKPLELRNVDTPKPRKGQILVKVFAIGANVSYQTNIYAVGNYSHIFAAS